MEDFKNINVVPGELGYVEVTNPTMYPVIDKGGHGALFDLLDGTCVKIFAEEEHAAIEAQAYVKAQDSVVIPRLLEIGSNYIVMEFVDGLGLDVYLDINKSIDFELAQQLVFMFREMGRIGFLRLDESLRHIIIREDKSIKIVDHFYAYSLVDEKPLKFFKQMKAKGVLEEFLEKVSIIDSQLYNKWKIMLPEYFTDI